MCTFITPLSPFRYLCVRALSQYGQTPLDFANLSGHTEVAKMLKAA